jgi:hypothetical protein
MFASGISMLPCSNCLRQTLLRSNWISGGSLIKTTNLQRHHTTFLPPNQSSRRALHTSPRTLQADPSRHRRREDRPRSDETTQTDFSELDVLGNIPPPASSIESCMQTGFVLSNGVAIQDAGMLLVGGEVFRWTPWKLRNFEGKDPNEIVRLSGQIHIDKDAWGILDLIWPKPGKHRDNCEVVSCIQSKPNDRSTRSRNWQINPALVERNTKDYKSTRHKG